MKSKLFLLLSFATLIASILAKVYQVLRILYPPGGIPKGVI